MVEDYCVQAAIYAECIWKKKGERDVVAIHLPIEHYPVSNGGVFSGLSRAGNLKAVTTDP